MELKELGQLLKEYNSRVYRIRGLTMAKKFLKLDGDKLSQVLLKLFLIILPILQKRGSMSDLIHLI